MATIDPEFVEKPFNSSFDKVNYNKPSPKLKNTKLNEGHLKTVVKMVEKLSQLTAEKWSSVPGTSILYSGHRANQIKRVDDNEVKNIIINAFADNEADYSKNAECYPSYLSISKETRLFGYQWKGVFNIVIIDLNHSIHKKK